ncbi:MAG: FkbM family methyltransferase [Pirellulaceae bacterium]
MPPVIRSETDFLDLVINQYLARFHQVHSNNYDAERFSFDGVDRSQEFALESHRTYLYFFMNHYRDLYAAWKLMADQASRELYLELILYQLLGHLHSKLPTNTPEHWAVRERLGALEHSISELKAGGVFGELRHYDDYAFEGQNLSLDCWPIQLAVTFEFKQYYFETEGIRIRPESGDYIVDAGACFGDTALAFATTVGKEGRVYSLEPFANNLRIFEHNLQQNPELKDRIQVISGGAGDQDNDLPLLQTANSAETNPGFSLDRVDQAIVPVRTIDTLVKNGTIERVDFLKMDIEGYELRALAGAEQTIRNQKPKLAISAYHRREDLFAILNWIASLDLGYHFHLGHYTIFGEETILYASVEEIPAA